ncbi:MAG TPA: bacillithiol biosynthesis cysteine-adding enzyme BshC [Ferruginibacter sp.]|jgi:bacillithiol biosynthesis cysteine-adding enzyme BshC|nr:bacillithiol biosynthesis cysteine-adding enzyme BshC [Ferruginibacter sp.]
MNLSSEFIDYTKTGFFSKTVADYIAGDAGLKPFYQHPVSIDGVKAAIQQRKKINTDRKLLVDVLTKQYSGLKLTAKQQLNIQQLSNTDTFTITTAHQPNIFTGPLYFIYKILHTIKLAETLQKQLPENKFVPVYYMGSEDADLDELGHIHIDGEKFEWKTNQTGAVGRMKVDAALIELIQRIEGQLLIYPFGKEIIDLTRSFYTEGTTIEQATFKLVNALFAEYGLIILLPDNADLKRSFIPVIEKELKTEFSHKAVAETVAAFPHEYKVQASGRELNLFYLKDDKRERIEMLNAQFSILNFQLKLSEAAIIKELNEYPERFSPNVILRPVFQEFILPNIAFIGGGGEIAYWLELKKVFEAVNVPYPILILRNSFVVISKEIKALAEKLQFNDLDLFKKETDLLNELVKRDTEQQLNLEKEKKNICAIYKDIKSVVAPIDTTLNQHVQSLHLQTIKKLEALEKKMLRAEKRKFQTQQRQLHKIKTALFPHNNLQERIDSILPYYAHQGKDFINALYENSLSLEQQFGILTEK